MQNFLSKHFFVQNYFKILLRKILEIKKKTVHLMTKKTICKVKIVHSVIVC